jgi:hypothetical protein
MGGGHELDPAREQGGTSSRDRGGRPGRRRSFVGSRRAGVGVDSDSRSDRGSDLPHTPLGGRWAIAGRRLVMQSGYIAHRSEQIAMSK